MDKKRIAMIFPYAPSYREAIYKLMDREMDIDWYFAGNCKPNMKLLDYSKLKNVDLSLEEIRFGLFSTLKGFDKIDLTQYDAVITPGVFRCWNDLLLMFRNSKNKKPRLYLWTHGWYGKESLLIKAIKRFIFHRVDGIFLYGDRAKRLMTGEGFDEHMLHVIHNSLDYDKQLALRTQIEDTTIYRDHFKNTHKTLIFIGRLTPIKKLELLIEALHILALQGENHNLVLVGDGEMKSKLEALVDKYNLKEQVWFYGQCYDEATNAGLIYDADLCVSPGNVGLASIHSLMFGCPVISNDNFKTQMPEFEVIKPGITGDFFKAYNTTDLADKISNWFKSHEGSRHAIREACFKIIDNEWNPQYQLKVLSKVFANEL